MGLFEWKVESGELEVTDVIQRIRATIPHSTLSTFNFKTQ